MLLALDVGNSNLVVGLFEGELLASRVRLESSRTRTPDEYAAMLEWMLQRRGLAQGAVQHAALCSVVPSLTDTVAQAAKLAFGVDPLVVGPGVRTGMPVRSDQPREVGPDRIANAVAAYAACNGACVVVDCGTATTLDVVSARGEFLGGVICPGLQCAAEALSARAARLPHVDLHAPATALGRNTVHAMQAGLVLGHGAMIDGLVARLRADAQLGECPVLATGGLLPRLLGVLQSVTAVDDALTLRGLRLIHERARG